MLVFYDSSKMKIKVHQTILLDLIILKKNSILFNICSLNLEKK
jgi:hypothetical protein